MREGGMYRNTSNMVRSVQREGSLLSEIQIKADIAGSIWKIVKAVGNRVAEGDQIMIMESMKMEIPVIASEKGTIKEISVAEGDTVQEGTVLAILDV